MTSRASNVRLVPRGFTRAECGAYLIELIVAISVSAIIGLALTATLSNAMRASSSTQNQIVATMIAQEILERVKSSKNIFDVPLVIPEKEYRFNISSSDSFADPTIDFLRRPILFDVERLKYIAPTSSPDEPAYRFRGMAKVMFKDVEVDVKTAVVTVSWVENSEDGIRGTRTLTTKTLVSRYGKVR